MPGADRRRQGDSRTSETYTDIIKFEPGEVYEWKIAVCPTARVFEVGHCIRIDITSSDFPRYNRNPNTGEWLTGEEIVEADQTIYHSSEYPSNVELPIVPTAALE